MTTAHIVTFMTEGKWPGRIVGHANTPLEVLPTDFVFGDDQIPTDEVPDIPNSYVHDGQVVARPAYAAVLQGLTLGPVPLGTQLTITGQTGKTQTYTTDNETITLAFPRAGVYKILLDSWPYLPKSFEVTV